MADAPPPPEPPAGDPSNPDLVQGQIRHRPLGARVPEAVGRGVFSTGAIVLAGRHEFMLDFILRMSPPHRVVARVILPTAVVPQVLQILRENLSRYRARFGEPTPLPRPDPSARKPGIEEIYDELKLPEEVACGAYANGAMISHGAAEFCLDFIAGLYPRPSVTARVFLAAAQVPRLLEALQGSWQQHEQRQQAQRLHDQQVAEGEAILRRFQEEAQTPPEPPAPAEEEGPQEPPADNQEPGKGPA